MTRSTDPDADRRATTTVPAGHTCWIVPTGSDVVLGLTPANNHLPDMRPATSGGERTTCSQNP